MLRSRRTILDKVVDYFGKKRSLVFFTELIRSKSLVELSKRRLLRMSIWSVISILFLPLFAILGSEVISEKLLKSRTALKLTLLSGSHCSELFPILNAP